MRKTISVRQRGGADIERFISQKVAGLSLKYLAVYPSASPEILWAMARQLDPIVPGVNADEYDRIIKSQCMVDTSTRASAGFHIQYILNCNIPDTIKYLKVSGDSEGLGSLATIFNAPIITPKCPSLLQLFSWAKSWQGEDYISNVEDFICNRIVLERRGHHVIDVPIDIGCPEPVDVQYILKNFTVDYEAYLEYSHGDITGHDVMKYFRENI